MANCKLTQGLHFSNCEYEVAGARFLYLANWHEKKEVTLAEKAVATPGMIVYHRDADGLIDEIALPETEKLYVFDAAKGTLSFTDALTAGGNGAKFRTQTVNAMHPTTSVDVIQSSDALSLGRFVAFIGDSTGRIHCLGRNEGLSATQFDHSTGAAESDAKGWTAVWAGSSLEAAPLVKGMEVIAAIVDKQVILA